MLITDFKQKFRMRVVHLESLQAKHTLLQPCGFSSSGKTYTGSLPFPLFWGSVDQLQSKQGNIPVSKSPKQTDISEKSIIIKITFLWSSETKITTLVKEQNICILPHFILVMGVWRLQALERERSCVKVSYPGGLLFSNLRYAVREKKMKIVSTDIGTIYHLLLWEIKGYSLKIVHYLFLAGFLLSYFLAEIINLGRSHCENKYCYISKYIHCSFIYSHFCPFSRRKYRFYICYLWFSHSHYFFLSSRERSSACEGNLE